MLQDLATGQQPGLFAFSYGLVAMLVVALQQIVYRQHPLTHASLALVGGLMTAAAVLVQGWIHPPGPAISEGGVSLPAIRISPSTEFARVLYTAVLAPLALGALHRAQAPLRLPDHTAKDKGSITMIARPPAVRLGRRRTGYSTCSNVA